MPGRCIDSCATTLMTTDKRVFREHYTEKAGKVAAANGQEVASQRVKNGPINCQIKITLARRISVRDILYMSTLEATWRPELGYIRRQGSQPYWQCWCTLSGSFNRYEFHMWVFALPWRKRWCLTKQETILCCPFSYRGGVANFREQTILPTTVHVDNGLRIKLSTVTGKKIHIPIWHHHLRYLADQQYV